MGTTIYDQVKALLFKSEVTYGVDPTPAAANVVRAFDLSITPIEKTVKDRASVAPHLGAGDTFIVGKHVKMDFKVELAGSGAAGTAPAWGSMMKACGMAEVVAAATSVTYSPVSADFGSGAMYFFRDGVRHVILGARGNAKLNVGALDMPHIAFSFIGLYGGITAAALPVGLDWSAYKNPVAAEPVNDPVFSLQSYAAKYKSAEIDLGQKVEFRALANDHSVIISSRAATAKVNIQEVTPDVKDYWAALTGHVKDVFTLQHGATAGNIVTISAPKLQIVGVSPTVEQGISHLNIDASLKPDAGNDELTLVLT